MRVCGSAPIAIELLQVLRQAGRQETYNCRIIQLRRPKHEHERGVSERAGRPQGCSVPVGLHSAITRDIRLSALRSPFLAAVC